VPWTLPLVVHRRPWGRAEADRGTAARVAGGLQLRRAQGSTRTACAHPCVSMRWALLVEPLGYAFAALLIELLDGEAAIQMVAQHLRHTREPGR
jgi:hypothetical protein